MELTTECSGAGTADTVKQNHTYHMDSSITENTTQVLCETSLPNGCCSAFAAHGQHNHTSEKSIGEDFVPHQNSTNSCVCDNERNTATCNTSTAGNSNPTDQLKARNSNNKAPAALDIDSTHSICDKSVTDITENLDNISLTHPCAQIADSKHCENTSTDEIHYVVYESELQMQSIMNLITKDLSEPYSIYTYRYFIHNWPKLCFLAYSGDKCVGAIVCKLDQHKKVVRRGYIAMLAIEDGYRRRGIGSTLVTKSIRAMVNDDCDEVVLETEITNKGALKLYENLGFVRDKRLFRYYLNGVDALRLKLWLR